MSLSVDSSAASSQLAPKAAPVARDGAQPVGDAATPPAAATSFEGADAAPASATDPLRAAALESSKTRGAAAAPSSGIDADTVDEMLAKLEDLDLTEEELAQFPPERRAALQQHAGEARDRIAVTLAIHLERQGPPTQQDVDAQTGRVRPGEDLAAAQARYESQLETVQQAALAARERRFREAIAATPQGKALLAVEQSQGIRFRIETDRAWKANGHEGAGAFSSGDDIAFNTRQLTVPTYVHEMTHQIDHRTGIIALEGDPRTKEQVVAEATARYAELGLDASEVPAFVEATYHASADRDVLTHAHTRLAEAQLMRSDLDGPALDDGEIGAVLELAVPREADINAYGAWKDGGDDAALLQYAGTRGIETAGRSGTDVVADLDALIRNQNDKIDSIARHGGSLIGTVESILGNFNRRPTHDGMPPETLVDRFGRTARAGIDAVNQALEHLRDTG